MIQFHIRSTAILLVAGVVVYLVDSLLRSDGFEESTRKSINDDTDT